MHACNQACIHSFMDGRHGMAWHAEVVRTHVRPSIIAIIIRSFIIYFVCFFISTAGSIFLVGMNDGALLLMPAICMIDGFTSSSNSSRWSMHEYPLTLLGTYMDTYIKNYVLDAILLTSERCSFETIMRKILRPMQASSCCRKKYHLIHVRCNIILLPKNLNISMSDATKLCCWEVPNIFTSDATFLCCQKNSSHFHVRCTIIMFPKLSTLFPHISCILTFNSLIFVDLWSLIFWSPLMFDLLNWADLWSFSKVDRFLIFDLQLFWPFGLWSFHDLTFWPLIFELSSSCSLDLRSRKTGAVQGRAINL